MMMHHDPYHNQDDERDGCQDADAEQRPEATRASAPGQAKAGMALLFHLLHPGDQPAAGDDRHHPDGDGDDDSQAGEPNDGSHEAGWDVGLVERVPLPVGPLVAAGGVGTTATAASAATQRSQEAQDPQDLPAPGNLPGARQNSSIVHFPPPCATLSQVLLLCSTVMTTFPLVCPFSTYLCASAICSNG